MNLFNVCNTNMVPHLIKPISETHSRYFLDLLNEYDAEIQNMLYYGVISYNTCALTVGTEYDFENVIEKECGPAKLFDSLVNPEKKRYQDLNDIFCLANDEKSGIAFIPVFVNERMLMFVCVKDVKTFLQYMRISSVSEIYNSYPVLCEILKWGITYMISDNRYDRINDLQITDIRQSENYIKVYNEIVDNVMRAKWLPYASTIHSIAGWNYEKQANYGYIDFIEPFHHSKNLQVKFSTPFMFSASKARTIRKYVELSNEALRIKAESSKGYIFGDIPEDSYWTFVGLGAKQDKNVITLSFEGKASWRLCMEKEYILYNGSTYSLKRVKEESPDYVKITEAFYREKEYATKKYDVNIVNLVNQIIEIATLQSHGTMVVFSPNASDEAERLCKCGRGIKINPINFKELMEKDYRQAKEIMYNLTKIDGAIFFDENGVCYSIGTIVDGRACYNSNPGRGARYNSGLTYVHDCNEREIQCYCAVISEDRTVDLFGMFGKTICDKIKKEYERISV